MIDALFGSKTRVKLLHLFLNNPGKAFYVREITRLIDEQINSVRRELSNMMTVGIVTSDTADNKLYYEVNQRYEHYVPLRAIFADQQVEAIEVGEGAISWQDMISGLPGTRLAVTAGVLVRGSTSSVDILLVGETPVPKVKKMMKDIEKIVIEFLKSNSYKKSETMKECQWCEYKEIYRPDEYETYAT